MATLQHRVDRLELAEAKGKVHFVCKGHDTTEEEARSRYFREHSDAIETKGLIYIQLPVGDPDHLPDGI